MLPDNARSDKERYQELQPRASRRHLSWRQDSEVATKKKKKHANTNTPHTLDAKKKGFFGEYPNRSGGTKTLAANARIVPIWMYPYRVFDLASIDPSKGFVILAGGPACIGRK